MLNPDDEQIRKLLLDLPDVRIRAKALFKEIRSITGPGSGYDVRHATNGLASICAFIAAQEAGYDNPSTQIAQKASCLEPKVFDQTLATVQRALIHHRRKKRSHSATKDIDGSPYLHMLEKHRVGQRKMVSTFMEHAEVQLVERAKEDYLKATELDIRVASFAWVCEIIKKPVTGKGEALCAEYGVQLSIHLQLVAAARRKCKELRGQIVQAVEDLKTQRAAKMHSRTPSRLTATSSRVLPTPSARTSAPTKAALRTPGLTRATPADRILKRTASVVSDVGDDEDTPSKRQRMLTGGYKTPHTPAASKLFQDIRPVRAPEVLQPHYSNGDGADRGAGTMDEPTPPPSSEGEVELETLPTFLRPEETARKAGPSRYGQSAREELLANISGDNGTHARSVLAGREGSGPDGQVNGIEEDEEDILPPVRRYRPVFADRVQWRSRAPPVDRAWDQAEVDLQLYIERHGRPFEHLESVR